MRGKFSRRSADKNKKGLQVLKPAALEANAPQPSKAVPERAPKAAPHSFATEELQYHASEAVQVSA